MSGKKGVSLAAKVNLKDEYTKEEVDKLPLEVLEQLAKNLEWRTGGGRYSDRQDMRQYKHRGFPRTFSNGRVTSREEFLRRRLKQSPKALTSPEARARKKKEEEAREAKKPKVEIKAKTSIVIELKDCRPKGHTFTIERQNGSLVCRQKQHTGAAAGTRICTTAGTYTAEDFEAAVEFAASIQTKTETKTHGQASLSVTTQVFLRGSQNIYFIRDEEKIWITRYGPHSYEHKGNVGEWCFNTKDLRTVVTAFKKKYEFVEVKEKEKK